MNNVIPGLRRINLIDDDGKPTGLAVSWRDDGQYRDACDRIVKEVYPQELLDIGTDDRSGLQGWFARNGHVGESAAGKMAALYL